MRSVLKKFQAHACAQGILAGMMLAMSYACSEDLGLATMPTETYNDLSASDPNHTWITAVSVRLDIKADTEGDITAQSIVQPTVTVFGKKHIKGSNVMYVDVPLSAGTSFGVVFDDGTPLKRYQRIELTGAPSQAVDVDFTSASSMSTAPKKQVPAKAATNKSLYGSSYIADCDYLNFGSWAWESISQSLKEAVNCSQNYVTVIDYEIISKGDLLPGGEFQANESIYLSYLYGYTGQYSSRTLGYYYHKGDYSDIVFQDISEVLTYDYLNNKAKVQYQLDGNTHVWYDANFDYKDADGPDFTSPTTGSSSRVGDDAYNTLRVFQTYGHRVTAIRGLTFLLEVPAGKHFGFYLRSNEAIDNAQKTRLQTMGVPTANLPKYKMNFSNASMNANGTSTFRSAMAIYDNFTFMGLDDNLTGGDFDCNDVTFALSDYKGERLIPTFTEETLNSELNDSTFAKHPEYIAPPSQDDEKHQTWTLAFENNGMNLDGDYNDVVLSIVTNEVTHKAAVSLLAAGAQSRTEIYYDDTYLGEVHELFSVDQETMVNTQGETATVAPVSLGEVDWPDGYLMSTDRQRFTLRVYNRETGLLSHIVRPNELIGQNRNVPQALCIYGPWEWPREKVWISIAYPIIGNWGVHFNNSKYWNWYSQPTPGKVVKPYSAQ